MMAFEKLRQELLDGNFNWSKHALDKCDIYGFDENQVNLEVCNNGELIEYHYWHGYGDKYIVFVNSSKYGFYHVVILNNEILDLISIKTVYRPDGRFFEDGKTKKDAGKVL